MADLGSVENVASQMSEAFCSLGIGLCLCDAERNIIYANAVFLRAVGKDKDDNQRRLDEISSDMKSIISDTIAEGHCVRKLTLSFESDGETCICMASALASGEIAVILFPPLFQFDVTADIRRSALDALEDGYYEVDLRGRILWVNSGFCRISGYTCNEVVGKEYKIFFDEVFAKKIWSIFNEVFRTGKPSKLSNWMFIDKSGRVKNFESSISPTRDASGKINGFQGIARDITDRIRMEKELMRARKFEAIGILAGGIAHDYNNALTAVLGNISLAKMEISPENKNLQEVLEDAEKASLRAVELTRRLSTFARGGRPERKAVNIGDLIRTTAESVLVSYNGIWQVDLQDDLWLADIDEFQIGQVLTYLLVNAMEAMATPGRILIQARNEVVEHEESHHELSLQPGRYVVVSVSDEGEGIPPENIPKIFDPYFTTKEMASGMGLATSYAIIKRHHGYIDLKSTLGKGSTFYFYVPATTE